MPATKSSKPRRTSKPQPTASYPFWPLLAVAVFAAAVSAAAIWFFYRDGSLMNYGDAEAHLNIARRIVDSRTPGLDQIGTVWLPLPHLLMAGFVKHDRLWHNGLAGSIPSGICFVVAAFFLFASVRRIFGNLSCPTVATGLFVLNPNGLFLQSTAMTEPVFFACLFGMLYFSVLFLQKKWLYAVFGAGVFALLGSLTRYEGWFLMPFVALLIVLADREHWLRNLIVFCIIAGSGPLFWLGFNRWYFGNPLEFFNGPSSAAAIQAGRPYPGHGDWLEALRYYRAASSLATGTPVFWFALAGAAAGLLQFKRALWPVVFLALPPIFYIWSMHSSATPIFIPQLPPNGWYNTRYGLALLPLGALGAAAIAGLMPNGVRPYLAIALLLAGAGQWLLFPRPASWITWHEAQVNSDKRRDWSDQAAKFLEANYKPGENIFTSFGDMTGVYRRAGIPLRFTLTGDNGPEYNATIARPDLFLRPTWVVTLTGYPEQTAVDKARLRGPKYELVKEIMEPGGPVVQIYRRPVDPHWKAK